MSDEQQPKPPKKLKKGKRLTLNKETVRELDEQLLEQIAGGALGTGGGQCKAESLFPACDLSDNPKQCNLTLKCNT